MRQRRARLSVCLALLALAFVPRVAAAEEVAIAQQWQAAYPTTQIEQLPEATRAMGRGFIGDAKTWEVVWQAWMPGTATPEIDFDQQVLLYCRNTRFVNRFVGPRVRLDAGTAKLEAGETRTARPIRGEVMLLVVAVPREGIERVQVDGKTVPLAAPSDE